MVGKPWLMNGDGNAQFTRFSSPCSSGTYIVFEASTKYIGSLLIDLASTYEACKRQGFKVEKDDVRFAFQLVISKKKKGSNELHDIKIPVVINTGRLKVNNQPNPSSSQSTTSRQT